MNLIIGSLLVVIFFLYSNKHATSTNVVSEIGALLQHLLLNRTTKNSIEYQVHPEPYLERGEDEDKANRLSPENFILETNNISLKHQRSITADESYIENTEHMFELPRRTATEDESYIENTEHIFELPRITATVKPTSLEYPEYVMEGQNFNQSNLPICPLDLETLPIGEYGHICYITTIPSQFPPSCPYPLYTDYSYYLSFIIHRLNLTDKPFWAFAQKNTNTNNFEWINVIENDTINLNPIYENEENNSEKQCLIFNRTELVPVQCNKEYSGICIYDYRSMYDDSTCQRILNETCFRSSLGAADKCYCINENSYANSRNNYCTKLADIEDPYQNKIISERLNHTSGNCWLGLEMGSDITMSYNYWSNSPSDFSKKYVALSEDGWVLENDQSLKCAVCEVNLKFYDVRLLLQHNLTNNNIQLEVHNALSAFKGILCLTGNDSYYIPLTTSKDNYILQDLWLYNDLKEYCWCKTLQLPNWQKVYSNTIIRQHKMQGEVYVARWTVNADGQVNNTTYHCPLLNLDIVSTIKLETSRYLNQKNKIEIVCHYSCTKTNLTKLEEYALIKSSLDIPNMVLENFANAKVCLATTSVSGNLTLHWHETDIGSTIIAEEICLQENGKPVTRTCGGNFTYGAGWLPVNGSCADVSIPQTSIVLNDLLYKEAPTGQISRELIHATSDKTKIDSVAVHLVSQILKKIADREVTNVRIKDVVTVVNNIMQVDANKLKSSQEILNSTDTILWSFDEILNYADDEVAERGYVNESSDMLLMQATSLVKSDIKGYKLHSTKQNVFDASKLQPLHQYIQNDFLEEDLDLAIIIPRDLHDDIIKCKGSKSQPTLITSMFFDGALFNEDGVETGKPDGKIVSVLIPRFNCTFSAPIKVIFKASVNENTDVKCASWAYGSNDLMESIHGHWAIEQQPKIFGNMSQYRLCEYSHVTHFALLVLGENTNISDSDKKALDVITAVGSALSILGLLGVFLTAALFKVYRKTNGIVIQFSIAMAAQIILLFVADSVSSNKTACTVFGAFLHYFVLSQFFWMLTIAVLQYQRYVVIFSSPPTHLVAKACAFAWGIPLVPVIVIVSISTDNYGKNANGLCYAIGQYFTFGVLLPISIIILVNVTVFLRIMISVASSQKLNVHRDNSRTSKLQLRLAFMLFFLLGLTWGFGLLASIGGSVVYSYLFCLTATLQGFILFLFFIVLNEKTRLLWINMKTCCKKPHQYDVTQDSAGSVMLRKSKTTSTTNTDSATSEIFRKVKNRNTSEF